MIDRDDTNTVTTGTNCSVTSSQVSLNSMGCSEMNITRIRGTLKKIASFSKMNTLSRRGQASLHLFSPKSKS